MNILTFFIVTTTTMMSPILVVCTTTTLPPAGVGVVGKCSLHINYYLGRETHHTRIDVLFDEGSLCIYSHPPPSDTHTYNHVFCELLQKDDSLSLPTRFEEDNAFIYGGGDDAIGIETMPWVANDTCFLVYPISDDASDSHHRNAEAKEVIEKCNNALGSVSEEEAEPSYSHDNYNDNQIKQGNVSAVDDKAVAERLLTANNTSKAFDQTIDGVVIHDYARKKGKVALGVAFFHPSATFVDSATSTTSTTAREMQINNNGSSDGAVAMRLALVNATATSNVISVDAAAAGILLTREEEEDEGACFFNASTALANVCVNASAAATGALTSSSLKTVETIVGDDDGDIKTFSSDGVAFDQVSLDDGEGRGTGVCVV